MGAGMRLVRHASQSIVLNQGCPLMSPMPPIRLPYLLLRSTCTSQAGLYHDITPWLISVWLHGGRNVGQPVNMSHCAEGLLTLFDRQSMGTTNGMLCCTVKCSTAACNPDASLLLAAHLPYLKQLTYKVPCSNWKECWEHKPALHNLLVGVGDVLIKEWRIPAKSSAKAPIFHAALVNWHRHLSKMVCCLVDVPCYHLI